MTRSALLVVLAACYARPAAQPITPAMVAAWTRAAPTSEPPPADWRFTADAAVAYALRHAPDLADHRDAEAVALARIDAARQLTNPALHVGQSFDDALGGDRTVIAVRVAPDAPWTRSARIAEARAAFDVARIESVGATRALVARIHEAYARMAFGEATIALLDRAQHALDERRRVLAAQVAGNVATRLEAVLADQDAAELRAQAGAITVELAQTRAELAALVGIPPGQAWTATWDLPALEAVHAGLDRDALVARALAERPEIALAELRGQVADAEVAEEKGKRVPWFESVQVERAVKDTVEWAVSATVTVPLFSLNGGNIAVAEAARRHQRELRERLAIATAREVTAAVAQVEATGARAQELRQALAPLDQEIDALLAEPQTATATDPVKLLLLDERRVIAHRALIDASYAHRAAQIALEALVGGPL